MRFGRDPRERSSLRSLASDSQNCSCLLRLALKRVDSMGHSVVWGVWRSIWIGLMTLWSCWPVRNMMPAHLAGELILNRSWRCASFTGWGVSKRARGMRPWTFALEFVDRRIESEYCVFRTISLSEKDNVPQSIGLLFAGIVFIGKSISAPYSSSWWISGGSVAALSILIHLSSHRKGFWIRHRTVILAACKIVWPFLLQFGALHPTQSFTSYSFVTHILVHTPPAALYFSPILQIQFPVQCATQLIAAMLSVGWIMHFCGRCEASMGCAGGVSDIGEGVKQSLNRGSIFLASLICERDTAEVVPCWVSMVWIHLVMGVWIPCFVMYGIELYERAAYLTNRLQIVGDQWMHCLKSMLLAIFLLVLLFEATWFVLESLSKTDALGCHTFLFKKGD